MRGRVLTIREVDERLGRAARTLGTYDAALARWIPKQRGVDLEIDEERSWRNGAELSDPLSKTPYWNQFRADVDRIQILDREQEQRLARRVEFARRRLEWTMTALGVPADETQRTAELPPEVRRRADELHALRCEMVERNLYLVLINVERYVRGTASRVDLVQEGCLALFRAVDGFDWRRGLLFRTYAVHWLNQAFRNYLYNQAAVVRVPVYLQKAMKHVQEARVRLGDPAAPLAEIAVEADLPEGLVASALSSIRANYSLDLELSSDGGGSRLRDLLADESEQGPYSTAIEPVSLQQGLGEAMEKLSERERHVVSLRFGIGQPREHTLAEVAKMLGVSVERIRQIQVRAMNKLATPALRRQLDPWLN